MVAVALSCAGGEFDFESRWTLGAVAQGAQSYFFAFL